MDFRYFGFSVCIIFDAFKQSNASVFVTTFVLVDRIL